MDANLAGGRVDYPSLGRHTAPCSTLVQEVSILPEATGGERAHWLEMPEGGPGCDAMFAFKAGRIA